MLHLFTRVYLHVRTRTRAPIDRRYLFVSQEREKEREREKRRETGRAYLQSKRPPCVYIWIEKCGEANSSERIVTPRDRSRPRASERFRLHRTFSVSLSPAPVSRNATVAGCCTANSFSTVPFGLTEKSNARKCPTRPRPRSDFAGEAERSLSLSLSSSRSKRQFRTSESPVRLSNAN